MTTVYTASAMEQGNIGQQTTGRPVVYGTQGVISSGHYLTSMAGMRMLLSGGNAFDAVVAAGFAAAVTEPIASYSLAAEGVFMLYHAESGDLLSLSGQGTAPDRATVDWYRGLGSERDSYRSRSAGPPQLHSARRGGGISVSPGEVRQEDRGRGA